MADIRILEKYRQLSDDCISADGPFNELAEFYCFCAHFAFIKGGKVPNVKVSAKDRQIRDLVLNNHHYKEQIDILALAVTKDHTILIESDEAIKKRYEIFQNYVNFGIKLFEKEKKPNVTDVYGMDTVLEILRKQATINKKIEPESTIDVDVEF